MPLGPKTNIAPRESAALRGKALREAVPREEHGGWKAPKDRRDPVELVLASNEGRMPDSVSIRHGRMLQSPFTFYRGTAALMAADLAHTSVSGLRVQACGDAHLLNFGGFATPERNVIFDINDLDETLPAPWEWDLKRLTASVVVAGRHLGLRENDSVRAAGATVRANPGANGRLCVHQGTRGLVRPNRRAKTGGSRRETVSEEMRARAQERIEKARGRSVAEHDFPKLVEHHGARPPDQGQPAPDLPSQRGINPRVQDSIQRRNRAIPRVPARARPRVV